jgi:hypothetical protein
VLALVVDSERLGTTEQFAFGVVAAQLDPSGNLVGRDQAPDAAPLYTYSPRTPPPPPPPSPPSATGAVIKAVASPVAGKVFVVNASVNLSNGESVAAEKLGCSAKIGNAALAGKSVATGCQFKIPKTAKGKKLAVTVTVTYDSKSFAKKLNLKIR